MTMHRRVQATEEAVEKVMDILSNIMEDVEQLKVVKSHLDELRQEQLKMAGEFNAVKRGGNGGSDFNLEKVGQLVFLVYDIFITSYHPWSVKLICCSYLLYF